MNDSSQHIDEQSVSDEEVDGNRGSLNESTERLMNGGTWCTTRCECLSATSDCGGYSFSSMCFCPFFRMKNGATQGKSRGKDAFLISVLLALKRMRNRLCRFPNTL